MSRLKITLIRSGIGSPHKHRAVLMGLGLTKLHKTVIREDRPEIQGMIRKVRHLVYVEEIPEGQYETARDQTGTRIDETT